MSISFQHTTLPNGLTLIGEHNPQAQTVAAGYFVNTGSRDEIPELAGVSHFLEHMMFKGTAKRTAEAVNREFDELGANYNAYTNEERTVYYGAVLPERLSPLLDLLSDMMRPSLDRDEFALEKQVILEEIAMYQDRPNFKVFELGNTAFYQGHPLGNSILGSEASIKALSQEQMLAYFKKRYVPNNMILTLAGNFDWAEVTEQVTSLTESWNAAELTRAFPATQTRTGTAKQLDPNLKRAHVAIFAPGVSAQSDLRYAAALIGSCLGDSSGSRLYWALVDKGLVDSASLSHDSSDQSGAYLGYLSSAPEQLEQVLSIFDQELFKVENEGLDQAEWLRAQRKLATSITLRAETPYGRLMMLGSSYLYNRQYQTVDEVVQAVFSASLSDAKMLLAQKPFSQRFAMILNQAG